MKQSNHLFAPVRLIAVLLTLMAAVIACSDAKSTAKKIVALRNERIKMLDKLYAEYGGSDIARSVQQELKQEQASQPPEGKAALEGMGSLASSLDRGFFENTLRAVGQGETPIVFSEKAREFFARSDIRKQARKFCEIETEIALLEIKLQVRR